MQLSTASVGTKPLWHGHKIHFAIRHSAPRIWGCQQWCSNSQAEKTTVSLRSARERNMFLIYFFGKLLDEGEFDSKLLGLQWLQIRQYLETSSISLEWHAVFQFLATSKWVARSVREQAKDMQGMPLVKFNGLDLALSLALTRKFIKTHI